MGGTSGDALEGPDIALETAQVERIDNAPDAPGDMIVVDQAVDIERDQEVLGTVNGEVRGERSSDIPYYRKVIF